MLRFVLTRAGLLVPTFLGVALLGFALIRLVPGDPAEVRAGERGLPPERLEELRREMGLDRPLIDQFIDHLGSVLSGDLGVSIATRAPVLDEFLILFPATIELALAAMLVAALAGTSAGAVAALRRGTWIDRAVMGISLAGQSMPVFWWGLLLILFVSVDLGLTPVSGRLGLIHHVEPVTGFLLIDTALAGDADAFASALHHLILPAVALGTVPLAAMARLTRAALLEELGRDYVRTARAKGLGWRRVVAGHALCNALIPLVTVMGLQAGTLLGGAILTETVFAWPGVGKWMVDSIHRRDYPVLQGGVLLIAAAVMAVNLAVDLLYGVLDPRIRHAR